MGPSDDMSRYEVAALLWMQLKCIFNVVYYLTAEAAKCLTLRSSLLLSVCNLHIFLS